MFRNALSVIFLLLLCATLSACSEEVKSGNEKVLNVNDDSFKQLILESKGVVVVDFFRPDCKPCKWLAPTINSLAEDMPDIKFYRLDIYRAKNTDENYKITGYPTVIIFKDGKEVSREEGASRDNPKGQEEYLKKQIEAAKLQ